MAFCRNCGAEMNEGAAFCPNCGTGANAQAPGGQYQPAPQSDAEKNKVMGIIAYFWILWLVPILAAKESPFARFHANQGLVLWIVSIAINIVSSILGIIPVVGIIFSILAAIVSIACLVLAILGIISAVKGEMKPLPLIGEIKIIK